MTKVRNRNRSAVLCAACATVLGAGLATSATASPYASAVSETGGVVSFTLNQAASNVTIIRDGVPTALGGLGKGPQREDDLYRIPDNAEASYS